LHYANDAKTFYFCSTCADSITVCFTFTFLLSNVHNEVSNGPVDLSMMSTNIADGLR